MRKISKGYYIAAAMLFIWAAVSFYNYAAVSKNLIEYYSGERIILKLVQDNFIKGIVKALLAILILGIGFFRADNREEE